MCVAMRSFFVPFRVSTLPQASQPQASPLVGDMKAMKEKAGGTKCVAAQSGTRKTVGDENTNATLPTFSLKMGRRMRAADSAMFSVSCRRTVR